MDGITPSSSIALLGSLLAHAAFGVAMIGLGPVTESLAASKIPDEMVFFEAVEPQPEPVSPPLAEEPPTVRRVVRAPTPRAASAAPAAPIDEPPLVTPAPTAAPATAAVEPVVGLPMDATEGTDAKGFAAGNSAVGAKLGSGSSDAATGAVALNGVVGGTGDRSRAAGLADGRNWDCPFPQQAQDEGIDNARVTLEVQIGPDNAVSKATVVSDPGYGFGQEARRCALRRRWRSQLNAQGAPITGRAMVVVNFVP